MASIEERTDAGLFIFFAAEFFTSTLEQDIKQVIHLLTIHTTALLTEEEVQYYPPAHKNTINLVIN